MNIDDVAKQFPELKNIFNTVLSVDIGNTFTKTGKGFYFASRVSEVAKPTTVAEQESSVTWDGRHYVVGCSNGKLNMNANKYKSDHFKLCLLTAIALSFEKQNKIKVRLALGLPARYYDDHAVDMKNEIKKLDKQTITVEGTIYDIQILDVEIFKQGGTISSSSMDKFKFPMLLLDFGGGTLDASFWKHTKTKTKSKVLGMLTSQSYAQHAFEPIMEMFVTKINSADGSDGRFTINNAIEFLEENYLPFGEEDLLDSIKQEVFSIYIGDVTSSLKNSFNPSMCREIIVTGGPCEVLVDYLKEELDDKPKLIQEIGTQNFNALLFAERYKELLAEVYLSENNTEVAATTVPAVPTMPTMTTMTKEK